MPSPTEKPGLRTETPPPRLPGSVRPGRALGPQASHAGPPTCTDLPPTVALSAQDGAPMHAAHAGGGVAGEQVGQLQRPPHSCAGQQGCTGSLWPQVPCSLTAPAQVLQKDPKNEALDSPLGPLCPRGWLCPSAGSSSWNAGSSFREPGLPRLWSGAEQGGCAGGKGPGPGGALSGGPALSGHLPQQVLGCGPARRTRSAALGIWPKPQVGGSRPEPPGSRLAEAASALMVGDEGRGPL